MVTLASWNERISPSVLLALFLFLLIIVLKYRCHI
jgi:hypothetical protein